MGLEKIGLITYHTPHLKTEQVFDRIKNKGHEYKFYALPFKPRKKRSPLFHHRPDQTQAVLPEKLAKQHSIPYHLCEQDNDIDNTCDLYLVLGAGILSPECISGKKIINCHPGIIPASRGLDSFKWAIHEMKPLGITLHYIEKEVDAGEIISVIPTRVSPSDTIETVARQHYENEINCLSDFDEHLKNPKNEFANIPTGDPRMRMPLDIEKEMLNRFPDYVKKYGIH
ncbi:hypothetical protein BVX98_05025 [bacterium F11]|nr:hypothetical protein BVX98_05025 [bacterium F11]